MKEFLAYTRELLYLLGDNRRKLPWLVVLFLLSSLLDIIGLGIIGPYLALAMSPERFIRGPVGDVLARAGLTMSTDRLLITLGLVLVAVFLCRTVAAILINWKILDFSTRSRIDLQARLMRGYQRQPYVEYLQRNSSEYIKNIHEATANFVNGVQAMLRLVSDGSVSLVILAFLAVTNGRILAILLLIIGSSMYFYDRYFHRKSKAYGRLATEGVQRVVQGIHEGTVGFKEVRILGKEDHFHRMVTEGARDVSENWAKATLITMTPRYILEFVLTAFVVIFVLVSLLSGHGIVGLLPTLGVFAVASLRLMPSANLVSNAISKIGYGRHAISLIYQDLHRVERYADIPPAGGGEPPARVFASLSLDSVSFRYPGSSQWALKDLTLPIKAGESIGIIGPSGSGKTTLIDVLLGLLEPQEGRITFNGRDIRETLADWRSQVAYLPQEIFLIDSTLAGNVALGVDGKDVDEERVRDAIKQAQLSEMVSDLPKGLDTVLGERGVRLSGGQRQRVALARAFYFKRNVLVLDEATSALDHETEREIIEEIKRLKGQKTLIVIAHRLTTVEHCDRIYRLEQGRVVASGPYEAVVSK
jgi:ATP-binding cassette, subfamily B, bacterial PglK